ncbi:MAG: glycoside hydrolase family 20 zincin-like fold domain-containing protein [Flavitalea sp.]
MKKANPGFFFVFFFISIISAAQGDLNSFEKNFNLIPSPQKIELLNEKGITAHALQSIVLQGNLTKPVLTGSLKSLPISTQPGPGILVLAISGSNQLPASREGYILEARNNQVSITARNEAGIFYGCQTLSQLLEDANDQQLEIPACRITDYPDINYRAIHLDVKHHLDATGYYYDMMDRLAAIKINAIIIEFEDKLRYRKAPLVGSGNAISIDEFATISRYAKERNIEISPLIQGLGHASFILKHDAYKKLRDTVTSDWSFDPMNPETYALQFALYEDAITATPYGKYLHVGGDEVGNLGMSELSKKSGLTPMQLQMRWLTKVSEFAARHNRTPVFWDDMVFKLSQLYRTTWDPKISKEQVDSTWEKNKRRLEESISLFPKECIYMRWNYDSPDIPGNHKALDWYNAHQLKVMAATAAQTMWPMLPREQSNFQPIKDFTRITAEKKLEGILCTAWDDCSPHFETYWRGFHDFAFFSWNYKDVKSDDAHTIFRHRYYGPALRDENFDIQTQLEEALSFWDTALLDKGHRQNYPANIDLIELPDPGRSGEWTGVYGTRVEDAHNATSRYDLIKERIHQSLQLARRNDYTLQILNGINELQVYPAMVLALLGKFDKAETPPAKKAAAKEIENLVNSFSSLRKKYEDVFLKTRLLENPGNYLLDQNHHHHLANGTNNSDWMYVYELAMNKKISKWLTGMR